MSLLARRLAVHDPLGGDDPEPPAGEVTLVDYDAQNVNDDSVVFDVPAGTTTHDWMVVHIVVNDRMPTAPSTWRTEVFYRDGSDRHTAVYSKRYGGEATVTFTLPSSQKVVGALTVWRGVSTPGEATFEFENSTQSLDSIPPTAPPEGSVVLYHMHRHFLSDVDIDEALTEIVFQSTTSGNASSQAVAYETVGGTPPAARNFDVSAYTSNNHMSVSALVLVPEPEAGFVSVVQGSWHWGGPQPRMYAAGGKVYLGAAPGNSLGGGVVAEFDASDDSYLITDLHSFGNPNDHLQPALLVPTDDAPLVAYARHSSDNDLRYRLGTTPQDLSTLAAEAAVQIPSSPISYAKVYRVGTSDTIWMFTRSNGGTRWAAVKTTDYGDTWGTPLDVFASPGGLIYMLTQPAGADVLRAVLVTHPDNSNGVVAYCTIDLSSGDIDARDGTNLGNLDGTNLTLGIGNVLDQVLAGTAGNHLRPFDVSSGGNPAVVYSESTTSSDGQYKVVRWNGSAWAVSTVAASGETVRGDDNMTAGGCFVPGTDDEVILAVEDDGTWRIEKWSTDDHSTWTRDEVIAESTMILMRPWMVDSSHLAWVRVFSSPYNQTDYLARVEMVAL